MTDYVKFDDEGLLDILATLTQAAADLQDSMQRCEYEIHRRLQEQGATAMSSDTWTATLIKPTHQYDMGKLIGGLKELIAPAEWDRAYTPEHEETVTVPAKLDMRVAKTWRKYGWPVMAALEAATLPSGPGRLKLAAVEKEEATP